MFVPVSGLPASVIAVSGVGRITSEDYHSVLDPLVARATADGHKARLYLELGPAFEGYDATALVADAQLGMGHLTAFERMAVVTDSDWLRMAVHVFGPLMPGQIRVFPVAEVAAARAWISE